LNYAADHVPLNLADADEVHVGSGGNAGKSKKVLVCAVAGYAPDQRFKRFGRFFLVAGDAQPVTVSVT